MTPKMRRSAAYHEAGHAVIGIVLRLNVRSAEVQETDGRVGQTLHTSMGHRYDGDWPPAHRIRREILGLLAGAFAAKVADGRFDHRGARYDYDTVVDFALHLAGSGDDASRLIRRAEEQTRALVERHWPAIVTVADELMRVGTADRAFLVASLR